MPLLIKIAFLSVIATLLNFAPNQAHAYNMYCTRSSLPGFDTLICTFSWTYAESLIVTRRRQSTLAHSTVTGYGSLHTTGGVGSPFENTHFISNPSGLMEIESRGWLEWEEGDETGSTWWESLYPDPAEDFTTSLFPYP